jgi:glyoxylase-like metal-dependent hydrolase (beta-lactamase superfamily II)
MGSPHILIDCGSHLTYHELVRNIETLGVRPEEIGLIIATHSHGDHIGAAALFKENFNTRFAIHEGDAEEARAGFHDELSPNISAPSVEADLLLQDGQELVVGDRKFEIFHTPGHSAGSVCIRTQSKDGPFLLFTGDVVHGILSANRAQERGQPVFDIMTDCANGLERLLNLDFDYMFEGHVMPLMEDISNLDEAERHNFVDNFLRYLSSRRRGAENGKELIEKRIFLLRQGFVHLPDYYIAKSCETAGQ